jgi:hypothetical protein
MKPIDLNNEVNVRACLKTLISHPRSLSEILGVLTKTWLQIDENAYEHVCVATYAFWSMPANTSHNLFLDEYHEKITQQHS